MRLALCLLLLLAACADDTTDTLATNAPDAAADAAPTPAQFETQVRAYYDGLSQLEGNGTYGVNAVRLDAIEARQDQQGWHAFAYVDGTRSPVVETDTFSTALPFSDSLTVVMRLRNGAWTSDVSPRFR